MGRYLRRIDISSRSALLAAGDVLALALFVYAGELRHGFPPTSYPGRFAGTLVPFVTGWVVAATVAGLYGGRTGASLRETVRAVVPAWLGAMVLAHGLRATPLFHGGTGPAFVVVSTLGGGALVVGWRALVALAAGASPVGRPDAR
ncbi:MAG: DUF3054 domain-containing protein [Salinirussus sp.]